jgi:hypothetical protein
LTVALFELLVSKKLVRKERLNASMFSGDAELLLMKLISEFSPAKDIALPLRGRPAAKATSVPVLRNFLREVAIDSS